MPKRSNDFQKLIYLIHHQLMGEATVTESKFLHDSAANIDREVDIVIETQAGDYPLIIGIECQGRGRVATVEWVDQMAKKHETLPTDKLILVSQSGFTPAALTKAHVFKIKTMTLDQAVRVNWNGLVGQANLLLERSALHPTACFAIFKNRGSQTNSLQLDFDQQLYDKEGNDVLTVDEAVDIIMDLQAEDLTKDMSKSDSKNEKPYSVFVLEFAIPKGIYLMDTSGIKREISSFTIIGHCVRETELVDLQSGSFGSAHIAFGKTSTIDANSLISIVEHEDKPNTAAFMLPSEKGIVHIIDLKDARKQTD